MKLFEEYCGSSSNGAEKKALTKTSSFTSTVRPDSNELPDSLLHILKYIKGRHELGPPIYLGDDPEPEDTVYDTTVNPLPPSPSKPTPGRIPRYERTQIQLSQSRKSALFASPKETDNQESSIVSTDLASSSGQTVDGERHFYHNPVEPNWNPETSSEGSLPQSCSPTDSGTLNFIMLNARRLKDFLTENVDEHAKNLLFLTIHGTLLAHNLTPDPAISVKAFRKFSAFAGPTFSLHNTAIATTGKLSPNPGFFGGKVLKVVTRSDEKGLKSMIVEQDGVVSAVVYCKDDTLIAAQLPKASFPSNDELVGKAQNSELEGNDPAIGQIENGEDGSDESDETGTETEDGASSDNKGKGKALSEDSEEEEKKPSKVRILELRAEAVAEVMVEDELKDFVMPKDFY